ncbi:CBS domain-containing membrane protein [Gammaproteobacteria bacterium]
MNLRNYLDKMRGNLGGNSSKREIIWSWIGGFLGISAVAWMSAWIFGGNDLTLVISSMGSSAVLVYGNVDSPLAQPRNLIGGHILSAIVGVACYKLFLDIPWLAAASAVATSIAAMHMTRTLHPPGGSTALFAVVGSRSIHDMGWNYVLLPATVGPLILLAVALLTNNISDTRSYPKRWF